MAFKELSEFSDGRRITLPIRGKDYVIEDVDGETGLWCQRLWDAAHGDDSEAALLDDEQERTLYVRVLGDTLTQMKADGVRWGDIRHAGQTAYIWVVHGEAAAEAYWEGALGNGGDDQGEASTPDKPASRPASGGAESTTKSRASGSGTRAGSRTKSKTKPRRGQRSSSSGA